jgi:hypothetical protein
VSRCHTRARIKALGTDAPIRADVQHDLAAVLAEQESRAAGSEPHPPPRDVSKLAATEVERIRRELAASRVALAAGLTGMAVATVRSADDVSRVT